MKSKISKWMCGLFLVTSVANGQVNIPAAINYQGKLTNPTDGKPVDSGVYHVEFRVWGHPTSTDASYAEWGRSFPVHVVTNGLFNILITNDGGELTNPTPQTNDLRQAFMGADRYLGLKITQGPTGSISAPEISPRQRLVSAPFAMHAQNCTEAYHSTFADEAEENFMVPGTVTIGGKTVISAQTDLRENLHVYKDTTVDGTLQVKGSLSVTDPSTVSGHGTIPLGGIIIWSGAASAIPSGWALCDGGSHSGHVTPDLRDRFLVGAGSDYSVGATGGEKRVTLTEGQMPKHHHAYSSRTDDHGYLAAEHDNQGYWKGRKENSDTNWAGNDESHENRPPFYALCYVMRVK